MFIVNSYGLTVILCFVIMLCWGSWGNTQKLAAKHGVELFYWDYAIGTFLFALILAFTLRKLWLEGRSFSGSGTGFLLQHRMAPARRYHLQSFKHSAFRFGVDRRDVRRFSARSWTCFGAGRDQQLPCGGAAGRAHRSSGHAGSRRRSGRCRHRLQRDRFGQKGEYLEHQQNGSAERYHSGAGGRTDHVLLLFFRDAGDGSYEFRRSRSGKSDPVHGDRDLYRRDRAPATYCSIRS